MKLLNRMANSINSKLFVPLLMVFFIAIGLFFIVLQFRTDNLVQQRLHNRAFELAESFAVATEVNTGQANFVRVVNSIGAYDDIEQLFLLDDANQIIVAASKNRYNNAAIAQLDEPLLSLLLSRAMTTQSNRFLVLDSDHDVFIYKMQMIAENRQSLRSMTLYIEIDNSGSVAYINSITLYFLSTLIALLSTVALLSFIFIRFIVLSPIYQLVRSIKLTKKQGEPVVSPYQSKDQLGVLTRVYNELIIDNDNQQQQLKAERARSETALQAKQQFLAMMTHELRTPLNGVIGMSEQLAALVDQPQQQKYVEVIQLSAQQLLAIINDTLDFSKIEADKLELDIQPLDINDTISSVMMMFDHKEDKQAVTLNFRSPEQSIPIVEGDSTRIIQIVINLLGNAMKFTEHGHVDVPLAVVSQAAQDISFTISVSDTGIGLSADQISTLFTEFSQADSSTTRQYGGTGLGLWISKKLVEKMAGEITVSGELGKGAEFVVHLTLAKSKTLSLEAPAQSIDDGLAEKVLVSENNTDGNDNRPNGAAEILLVEDTDINRMVVTAILGDQQLYAFDIAVNGLEAVNLCRQRLASGTRPYDIILMDCLMPVMDGFEASKTIRELEQNNDTVLHTPIIALTANALDKTKEQCLAAGMDEFLTKPIESEVLIGTVEKWLKNQRKGSEHRSIN